MAEGGGGEQAEPDRLLSDGELEALGRSAREQLAAAIAEGEPPESVLERFDRLVAATRGFIDGFHAFGAAVGEHVARTGGHPALAALEQAVFVDRLRAAARFGCTPESLAAVADRSLTRMAIAERLAACDPGGALAAYDDLEAALRAVHATASATVAAQLSHVYRTQGVDGLEACLRHCGERTLLGWMPRDLQRSPAERVRRWAGMLVGNFATVRVEETDDAFVLVQDPCGTCARQVLAGCYEGPDALAVVSEPHPITWSVGGVPVYRTHVAVMHDLMPLERIGARWPEIDCPRGLVAGPCRVVLRKDASSAP